MNIQPVSTKQLRQEMPNILERLLMGQSFYWIHRSQPVGVIHPLPKKERKAKVKDIGYEKLVEKLAGGIKLKKYPTPSELNKIIDQEYQTYV